MSPGRLPTVPFTLLSVSSPLAIMFLFSVSVILLLRHFNTFSLHAPWPSVLSRLLSLMVISPPLCPSLSCHHVLFSFHLDELHCVPRIFVYILNVCKLYIWHTHNDFQFHDVPLSAIDFIASVRALVHFNLPLFCRRFHSTRRCRFFPSSVVCQGCHCHHRERPLTSSHLVSVLSAHLFPHTVFSFSYL